MSGKSQGILKWMISGNPDFPVPLEPEYSAAEPVLRGHLS